MRRRGFLLLDALLALGILSLVAAGAIPLIADVGSLSAALSHRIKTRQDAAFSAEYVTEAARFARARSTNTETIFADSYAFKRKSSNYGVQTYKFSVTNGILRFHVYEGGAQPVTGDNDTSPSYRVVSGEKSAYFTQEVDGLLSVSYAIRHATGAEFSVETSVLPLSDFLKMGEYFE